MINKSVLIYKSANRPHRSKIVKNIADEKIAIVKILQFLFCLEKV